MSAVAIAAGALAAACAAAAAVDDVRRFEIRDLWSIAIALLFLVAWAAGGQPDPWWSHLAAGAGVFGLGVLCFSRGWLGGGDVKLLGACALWAGLGGLPLLLGGTAMAGGLLAVAAVVARRFAGPAPVYPGLQKDGPLPYAVAILAGVALMMTRLL